MKYHCGSWLRSAEYLDCWRMSVCRLSQIVCQNGGSDRAGCWLMTSFDSFDLYTNRLMKNIREPQKLRGRGYFPMELCLKLWSISPRPVDRQLTILAMVDVRRTTLASVSHQTPTFVYSTMRLRQRVARVHLQQLIYLYTAGDCWRLGVTAAAAQ